MKCTVASPFSMKGKKYVEGESIELDSEQAARLSTLGLLKGKGAAKMAEAPVDKQIKKPPKKK